MPNLLGSLTNSISGFFNAIPTQTTTTTVNGTGAGPFTQQTTSGQIQQHQNLSQTFPWPVFDGLTPAEVKWLKKLINSAPLQRHVLMTLEKGEEQP